MIPFERLDGAFSAFPEEPAPAVDEEKEYVKRVIAADTMRLWFIGN